MENNKFFTLLGWVATVTAMAMYVSYIPQISSNLHGAKGDWLQPLVAAINCTLWVTYGLLKKPKRDWPLAIANSPGIIFGLLAFFTAL
ncbi:MULTISPECIES: SemiSWEET family transporter [Bacteroidota]|uniref:SemiSWEET family transporter n=1 Tax=Bacteroidota TaxID=976 RepID=UPI00241ECA5F|nr:MULTISPECIES: SemiSWEET family transporter [Bacteroidota]